MNMKYIFLIFISIFISLTFILTITLFYIDNSNNLFKVKEKKLIYNHNELNYLECNINFNGEISSIKTKDLSKNDFFYNKELCLSVEQVRIFDKTSNLRPRLNTNYSGYTGPWIEDGIFCNWILQYDKNTRYCNDSEDIPPVYIPIFWTSIQRNKVEMETKRDWIEKIQNIIDSLDPNILYFTVLQDAQGFTKSKLKFNTKNNLIIFNAGGANTGFKQIPIPLIKGELQNENLNMKKDIWFSSTIVKKRFPVRKKLFNLIKYVNVTDKDLEHDFSSSIINRNETFIHYEGEKFKEVIQRSIFHLCPRGFGRTSFRLYETIQLGTIPIYVWDDLHWLPYGKLLENLGVIINISELENLPKILKEMSIQEIENKLNKIKIYKPWFTYQGITKYIINILKKIPCDTILMDNVEELELSI